MTKAQFWIVFSMLPSMVAWGCRSGLRIATDGGATRAPGPIGGLPALDGGSCPPATSPCGAGEHSRCYALDSDVMNCGACDRACPQGVACVSGTCKREQCTGQREFHLIASHPRQLPGAKGLPYSNYLGADMDRDGRLDLLEYDQAGELVIWLGQRDGTFISSTRYATTGTASTWALPDWAAVGDFDEDGLADLAVTRDEGKTVEVRRGLPGGGLGGRPGLPLPRLAMADIDRDGHLDVVSAQPREGMIERLIALRGRGDGSFVPSGQYQARDDSIGRYTVQDWDGDGKVDLLVRGMALHLFPGTGDGTFGAEQRCAFGEAMPGTARFEDFNGDGRLDIVWHLLSMDRLATIMGTGTCTLPPRTDYAVPERVGVFTVGDLSGDGLMDIVVEPAARSMIYLAGNGDGTFAPAAELPVQISASPLFIADVNGDGHPDIVAASGDRGIEVFSNTCTR